MGMGMDMGIGFGVGRKTIKLDGSSTTDRGRSGTYRYDS